MKYEYYCFSLVDLMMKGITDSRECIGKHLSEMGEKGFKLIDIQKAGHVTNDIYVMEKQIEDGSNL